MPPIGKGPPAPAIIHCLDSACDFKNPTGHRFCGRCGQPLNPDVPLLVEWAVSRQLEKNYKEQKFLEIETAQAIFKRLKDWAEIWGTVFGICLAVLTICLVIFGVALSVWGISSYSDFQKKVLEVNASLEKDRAEFNAHAKDIRVESENITKQFQKDKQLLAELEGSLPIMQTELKTLRNKIQEIEDSRIKVSPLPPEKKTKIDPIVERYLSYLKEKLKLKGTEVHATFELIEGTPRKYFYVYADYMYNKRLKLNKNEIYVDPLLIDSDEILLHESTVPVLIASMPGAPSIALPEGIPFLLANGLNDYLVCSYLNESTFGKLFISEAGKAGQAPTQEPWLYQLDNDLKLTDQTFNQKPQIRSEAFAGSLWALRKLLTREVVDPLIAGAWMALKPEELKRDPLPAVARFRDLILEQDKARNGGKNATAINGVFEGRGLKP